LASLYSMVCAAMPLSCRSSVMVMVIMGIP
jgi:hypothetical protein